MPSMRSYRDHTHSVTSLHPMYRPAGDDVDLFKMSLLTQAEMIIIARSEEAT